MNNTITRNYSSPSSYRGNKSLQSSNFISSRASSLNTSQNYRDPNNNNNRNMIVEGSIQSQHPDSPMYSPKSPSSYKDYPRTPSPTPRRLHAQTDRSHTPSSHSHSHRRTGSVSGISSNFLLATPPNSTQENSYPNFKKLSVMVPNDIDCLTPLVSPVYDPFNTFNIDNDTSNKSKRYSHELSPKLTIENTNEQIRRNSVGTYSSLTDFAQQHHINVNGRIFVDKPQTPKINLDI